MTAASCTAPMCSSMTMWPRCSAGRTLPGHRPAAGRHLRAFVRWLQRGACAAAPPGVLQGGCGLGGSHNFRACTAAPCGMDRLFGGVVPATAMADGVPAPCRARQCGTGRQPARASAAGLWRTGRERATGADPAAGRGLNKAQRSYDLLYLARRDHELFRNDATYTHRMWDYFVRHLADQQPPDTVLAPLPGGPGWAAHAGCRFPTRWFVVYLKAVHVARSTQRQAMSYIDGFVLAVPTANKESSSPMHAQGIPFSSSTARCAWSSAGAMTCRTARPPTSSAR